jgi:hypothetical protein
MLVFIDKDWSHSRLQYEFTYTRAAVLISLPFNLWLQNFHTATETYSEETYFLPLGIFKFSSTA